MKSLISIKMRFSYPTRMTEKIKTVRIKSKKPGDPEQHNLSPVS